MSADRVARQVIMIAADAIRALLHATLAVLIFAGAARIGQIVVIEALFGAAQAFFQPAYSGLLPQTVPESLIQDARALTESTANVAFLIGPVLATALVLGVGAGVAFVFDAGTFVLSAVLLARVRPRPRGEERAPESLRAGLRGGWREVRSRTWVWVTIAVFAGAVMCVYSQWYALAPAIARDLYRGSAGVFGVLESFAGVGACSARSWPFAGVLPGRCAPGCCSCSRGRCRIWCSRSARRSRLSACARSRPGSASRS